MTKALTILAIRNLKPGMARREIPEGLVSGLYFILQPGGAASWALRYRRGGKPRKLTLGPYPAVELGLARDLARKAIGELAQGRDPAGEKQSAKLAARVPDGHDLVEKIGEQFIARHIRATMRPSWAREAERMVRKEIIGAWHGRRLSKIDKADIHKLLDAIVDRPAPILANRVFATLRRMCSWAVVRGVLDASPSDRVKPPTAEKSRDRVLSDDELRAVWQSAEALGWPFGPLVQLLALTGQRRDEVASARWSEVDFDAKVWTLPKERCKNNVAHHVPLSPQALRILENLPRIMDDQDFVFTTNGKTAVSGFSRAKRRLDAALPSDMEPWTFHDLRRTFASGCARLGVAVHVVEAALNHKSGTIRGVAAVYNRYSYNTEKRAALEAWSRFLEQLVSGEPAANVVEFVKTG